MDNGCLMLVASIFYHACNCNNVFPCRQAGFHTTVAACDVCIYIILSFISWIVWRVSVVCYFVCHLRCKIPRFRVFQIFGHADLLSLESKKQKWRARAEHRACENFFVPDFQLCTQPESISYCSIIIDYIECFRHHKSFSLCFGPIQRAYYGSDGWSNALLCPEGFDRPLALGIPLFIKWV